MSNMAAKLKPMDADLELKPALLVHLVMASLPKEFDTFVVNRDGHPSRFVSPGWGTGTDGPNQPGL